MWPNITGFTVSNAAQLAGSSVTTATLLAAPSHLSAEVPFTPDGTQPLIREKRLLDILNVLSSDQTDGPLTETSAGTTPFGFASGPGCGVIFPPPRPRSQRLRLHPPVVLPATVALFKVAETIVIFSRCQVPPFFDAVPPAFPKG